MSEQTQSSVSSEIDSLIDLKLVHEIHTSERKSFRACRRRWDWLFRNNYYPQVTAKPLEFGSAYHKAKEVFYDPDTWRMDREIIGNNAILEFVETCEKQKLATLAAQARLELEADVEQDYKERVELGIGMLKYYINHVSPKIDIGWVPVKVEIAFMVPIPNPETGAAFIWCKCAQCKGRMDAYLAKTYPNGPGDRELLPFEEVMISEGLPVVYAGRIDMLARDINGKYWIFDWKTARSLSSDTEFLYLDDQIGSYVWALRKLGLDVRGFVYHEQRKGYPEPPKKNTNRRLGRAFSVAKNQDTDWETYRRTVALEDTKAYEEGLYDEFLEFLQNEGIQYYARHQISKSEQENRSMEYNIGLEALDMIDPKTRIYPNAGRFGCTFCAFRQPCMEKNAGGDFQYALDTLYDQREHYYVREEPSTESKGGE